MNTLYKIVYSIGAFFTLMQKSSSVPNLFGYFFNQPVMLNLKNGLVYKTRQLMDLIAIKEVVLDDEYELYKLPNSTQFVIDIGAGLGDSTLLIARKFPKARVLGFEPNPYQYQLLKENIFLNKVKNIKVYDTAIGAKKTYSLFITLFNAHSSTIKNPRAKSKIKVKGQRLDRFIRGPVDLIKIDCEGGEIDVLKSIIPKQFAQIKRFCIEYHNHIIQDEDQKIISILKEYRYKVRVKKNKIVPTTGYIFAVK